MEKLLGGTLVILCLQLAMVNSQKEEEKPQTLSIQEGENVTMNCSYKSTISYLQWYRQDSGRGPVSIILIRTNEREKPSGRLRATLDTANRRSSLSISASQTADTATYFCATPLEGGGVNRLTFGTGTLLSVKPNITDPQPAVYQLRSSDSKSSKLSMCLLTDFDSQTNVSQRTESETVFTSHTVLNMKSLDSKSYGALAWSQNSRLSCQDAFSNHTFLSSSDASCDAKLVEKSFETDMNLNFQNLSVIGLRLLLLKVAGFNLLMTLRLWSS